MFNFIEILRSKSFRLNRVTNRYHERAQSRNYFEKSTDSWDPITRLISTAFFYRALIPDETREDPGSRSVPMDKT